METAATLEKTSVGAAQEPSGCEVFDHDNGLYAEPYFTRMLAMERKKSERTHGPIILMLADVRGLLAFPEEKEYLRMFVEAMKREIRDVDLCGWDEYRAFIGVLFTVLGDQDVWVASNTLAKRIRFSLAESLPGEVLKTVELVFHIFPESYEQGKPKGYINPTFYPDLAGGSLGGRFASGLKRFMDITGSLLALLLFSPLLLTIPAIIKATSPGPVLFRQERIGRFGRRFTFLKFRSMHVANDDSIHRAYLKNLIHGEAQPQQTAGGATVFKLTRDPRVTTFGRWLRKTSMDELPQFFNVLRGEMSLVGPRPPIPYEFDEYDIWHRYRLLGMKPGITGLWQVKGRSSTSFDAMVRLDISYIRNWSLWLDIKLLLQTPMAVLRCKGAC